MKTLFPPIKPFAQHMLEVDSTHKLYIEECGDPNGLPVLFVHGGPGGGCSEDDRRFFDPERYRVVLFDQRGCGQSIPHGSIENNTTEDLVSDIEAIREHLGIEKWMLFGGSWGSTLSLVYAQAFPLRVMAMIVRGIFLCREQDLKWFYQEGANQLFPDYWEEFVSIIPEEQRDNLIEAYHQILTGSDELARMSAAKHWSEWEGACATLNPCKSVFSRFSNPHTALSLACIENHYFRNKSFLKPNQILKDMSKISTIPGIIVHGRYDSICPLDNAYQLHKAWDRSELQIIRDAGHTSMEAPITDALIQATSTMAEYFQ